MMAYVQAFSSNSNFCGSDNSNPFSGSARIYLPGIGSSEAFFDSRCHCTDTDCGNLEIIDSS